MNEGSFEEQVKKELEKLNRQQQIEFAWRCAVRALPFLGEKWTFDYWDKGARKQYIHSIFYALDVTAVTDANAAHASHATRIDHARIARAAHAATNPHSPLSHQCGRLHYLHYLHCLHCLHCLHRQRDQRHERR